MREFGQCPNRIAPGRVRLGYRRNITDGIWCHSSINALWSAFLFFGRGGQLDLDRARVEGDPTALVFYKVSIL